ncbi:MAG TPA: EAL domain-containing protein, partial [Burkholderiales bacterium]|nr:EAL domain-containing protein [Burkholderiales bacterium]
FARGIRDQLNTHRISANMLAFEIEETALILNPTRVRETLSELHHIGVTLTVRNFGSAHGGSIGWIGGAVSPISDVKISRRHILDMPNNQHYFTYVQALIDVAHALKLKVGADGVESEAIWSELKTLGCDYAIGYFLSRPLPADEFTRWYRRTSQVTYLHRHR